MRSLPGYVLDERIHAGRRSVVYRGSRSRDGQPVVIKTPREDFPSAADLARFESEFELGHRIHNEHVIEYLGLEGHGQQLAIVEEDYGASALAASIPEGGVDLPQFLSTARQLAEGLEAIHRQNVIHKSISPHNIGIHSDTGLVKILDFSFATPLRLEKQPELDPDRIEDALAYISPEQTGRMNRQIDRRTDLYSLGATALRLPSLRGG
jgi:serine/threonine protein kinase